MRYQRWRRHVPPNGPIVRTAEFQAAAQYHVRYNGEDKGKLFIQNIAMPEPFIGDGQKEQFSGGYLEAKTWLNAVRGEGDLVVKPEQAYIVTRILEAIYDSAASGDIVRFD